MPGNTLYDVLGVGLGAGKPPGEAKQRQLVFIYQAQKRRFLTATGIANQARMRFSHV